jgi:hypothetical protein
MTAIGATLPIVFELCRGGRKLRVGSFSVTARGDLEIFISGPRRREQWLGLVHEGREKRKWTAILRRTLNWVSIPYKSVDTIHYSHYVPKHSGGQPHQFLSYDSRTKEPKLPLPPLPFACIGFKWILFVDQDSILPDATHEGLIFGL